MPKIRYSTSNLMPRKVALRASSAIDEPNLVIPLATSYNERGVAGFTHAVTNSEDQRKVNCFYELAKNAATGKGTLTLAKRPGVTIDANTYGASSPTSYLVLDSTGYDATLKRAIAVFNTTSSGTLVNVSLPSLSNNVLVATSPGGIYIPTYADLTSISNVTQLVVQLRHINTNQVAARVFFNSITNFTAGNAWTEITDADFLAAAFGSYSKIEHIDGFAFILSTANIIWNSDTNSLANWTATSFLAKQIQQDGAVGLARLGNLLLALGDNTAEIFFNNGNTTGSPLGRLPHLHAKVGLVMTRQTDPTLSTAGGTHYYATIGKKLFFVGRESGGGASVGLFVFDGQTFGRISSGYIDKILSERYQFIYSVNAVGVNGRNAIAIALTAPAATTQRWLMFFPDWQEWFEWTSTIFSPVSSGGYHLGVASQNKIYTFSGTDNWQDDGTSYAWSTQFKLPTNGATRKFMPMYGIDADTDTSANNLTVEISTDDSKTFSTLGTIDQTQDRKVLFHGGSFRKAHIRLGNTNARPTRIHNWLCRLE